MLVNCKDCGMVFDAVKGKRGCVRKICAECQSERSTFQKESERNKRKSRINEKNINHNYAKQQMEETLRLAGKIDINIGRKK